jgi:predicted membrane protein
MRAHISFVIFSIGFRPTQLSYQSVSPFSGAPVTIVKPGQA